VAREDYKRHSKKAKRGERIIYIMNISSLDLDIKIRYRDLGGGIG